MLVKDVCKRCHEREVTLGDEWSATGWTQELDIYWRLHRIVICPKGFATPTPTPSPSSNSSCSCTASASVSASPSPGVSPSDLYNDASASISPSDYYPQFRKNPFGIVASFFKRLFNPDTKEHGCPSVSPSFSSSILSSPPNYKPAFKPTSEGDSGYARFTKNDGLVMDLWVDEEGVIEIDIDVPPPWCEYALEHLTIGDNGTVTIPEE